MEASGSFLTPTDTASFKLFVPNGATVVVNGSADILAKDTTGGWQTIFSIDPIDFAMLGQYYGGPYYNQTFNWGWVNNGPSADIPMKVHQQYGTSVNWRFTVSVSSGADAGVCAPLAPEETLGDNCASKHATKAQVQMADPVNTATGNFHETFTDFVIPGRGPGLVLGHSYNSLGAGADGPVGFGWTHSYAMFLAVDPSSGVVVVTQEGGARVSFYPDGAGGYEVPPRAVATLAKNADGSFTFRRCNSTTLGFSPAGQLLSITDRNGYSTTLQYSAGKLATVTDAANRSLAFAWSGARLTSVTDASTPPRSVGFSYDTAGNLTDYLDAGGSRWHFTYDASHRLETMRRPRQAEMANPPVTRNVYDAASRVVSQTDELGRSTTFDYTSIPGSTKVTDPKSNVTVIAYTNYLPTSITRGWGSPVAATWRFQTDRTAAITKVTDPNGHAVANTYDAKGNLTSSTDALNRTTRATYNGYDQPLIVTDAAGVTTTSTYDDKGNLTTVATPLVGSSALRQTSFAYDPARPGDVVSVTDPKGKVWTRAYDGPGNLVSETDPLGNRARYGYDPATGRLTSAVSPRGVAAGVAPGCVAPALGCASFAYDAWGHVTSATDANDNRSTRSFDVEANLAHQVDANGNRTEFTYDAANQLLSARRADGSELASTYWPDGSLREAIDGAGRATVSGYDAQGRLTSRTDPLGRATTYGYDLAGNPVSVADAGGSCPGVACTSAAYDAANQLGSISYGDGVTPNVDGLSYDGVGRRTAMTDGSGTSTWAWDSLGRLTSATDGAGQVVSYGYANLRDPATTITYPGNKTVTHGFDDAGRMTTVTDWLSNTTTYSSDADANITRAAPPAGTGLVDTYAFDDADRLMGITATSGPATAASFSYGRDKVGQVSSVSSTGVPADNHTYSYTALNQLQAQDAATYAYDAADNLTKLASGPALAYDAANQACWMGPGTGACASPPAGATTFDHDARGNRTAVAPPGKPATALSWDQANRLTKTAPAAPNQGQYTPLSGARLLDTRPGSLTGVCPGTTCATLGAGQTLTLQVGGQGGVPASGAAAVVLSVTALYPTDPGYLTLWPADAAQPATSSINWAPGQLVTNLASVKLGADGTIKIFNPAGSTDVVIDVQGWYAGSDGGPGSGFNAINSARILDTRSGQGTCPEATCSTLGPGSVLKLQVSGQGGIAPSGVSAVALNLTVTNTTTEGYLTAWASNEARPPTASMVFSAGATVSVLVMAGVAPDGTVSIYNAGAGAVDIIGDVFGWYAAGLGSSFQPLVPARILDTHPGAGIGSCAGICQTLASGTTLVLSVAGQGGVPATGVDAVALNITAVNGGGLGYLTAWPTDEPQPVTTQMVYAAGQTIGNAAVVKLAADGTISIAAATGPVDLIVDVSGYFVKSVPTVTYAYGGDGLRTSKTVRGTTTRFTWEASSGLPLLIDDGTKRYVYGPGGRVLSHIDANDAVTWYHHDQLGSTRTLSNAAGATVATATYDPYGRPTASTGTLSPLGFAGEYTDAETGLIYLRARYYDPATGQFISRDPLEPVTGEAYGYAGGNPLNAADPTGLCPLCIPIVLGAVVGGVTDIGIQLAFQAASGCGVSLGDVNWASVGVSAAFGAISQGRSALRAPNTAGRAGSLADDVATAGPPNRIYSARELIRRAKESGPYHNFPGSLDDVIFGQGSRTVVRNYFNKAKPLLSNDSIQYRLPGSVTGADGMYEIFARPSISGRTEVIMHRFFRPSR